MKRMLKRLAGTAAAVLLAIQIIAPGVSAEAPLTAAAGFTKVCENGRLALFLNDENCFFGLGDKTTGKVLYSNPLNYEADTSASNRYKMELMAQFAFDYRKEGDKTTSYLNSYTASVRRGNFKIEKQKDGFTVLYELTNLKLTLPFSVKLNGDCIEVSADFSKLEGQEYQINNFMLLPYFGCGDNKTEGYSFVPDGSGAVINFNNQKTGADSYKQWIYGNDPANVDSDAAFVGEKAVLPVFGAHSANGSYLGIIEEGAPNAAVQAFTSGKLTMFNNVYPSFVMIPSNTLEINANVKNEVYGEKYLSEKVSVKYYPLSDKQSGYSGMAEIYRGYLEKNKLLPKADTSDYGVMLETYGAVRKKESIIGFPVTVTKKLTSFEDCEEIVKAMQDSGMKGISVEFNNWNKAGLSGKTTPNPKAISKIGGEKGRKRLDKYLSENGGRLYMNLTAMKYTTGSSGASTNSGSIKKLGNIRVEEYPLKLNTMVSNTSSKAQLYLNSAALDNMLAKLFKNLNKRAGRNIAFSDLGNTAYSDFSDKNTVFRGEAISNTNKILEQNRSEYDSLLLHNANMYSFAYAGYISDMPASSSGYSIVDESVPFLQLALHGSVRYSTEPLNMSANPKKALLKAIETGSELSFAWIYEKPELLHGTELNWLFASDYRLWLDYAAESYKKAESALGRLSDVKMTSHGRLAEGVYETVYADGTRVIVNYGGSDAEVYGRTVKAEDYLVIGEGK